VALVEGSVELQNTTNNKTLKLAPNQIAVLDADSKTLVSDDVTDLNKYTAWINGRIVFYGDPIQTVVKKLSNWYNIDIVISDKKLESYKFTGTFINEPVEQVLNVLSLTSKMAFEVEPAVKQADNTITKRRIILKSKI
jgi:ferric-dicitrate binding protein FerR (iron transport regulator)